MRVLPGILILMVVSAATGSASAAKFDLNSALGSVLKVVLDTRQFENELSYENDEGVDREIPLDSEGRPLYDSDIYEHNRRTREKSEEKRRKTEENAVYICDLDNQGYNIVIETQEDNIVDYTVVEGDMESVYESEPDYYHYYSDEYYEDKSKCEQRKAIMYNKTQEKKRQENAEYIAKISKLPEPQIGMTKDQVRKGRWGNPIIIELETDAQGKYEKWHYHYNKVLYFKNGKVTKITNVKVGS